jgi:PAS domain S-box-containing protein
MENVTTTTTNNTREAFSSSEERLRTLLQNIKDYAIFMLNTDGVIIEWTQGAQQMKGYTADEVIGKHYSMFFTNEDIVAGKPADELLQAARVGRAERVGIRIRKGGEHFWVEEIATAVRDANGMLTGFTKISRDITDRKKGQQALRESEERLRVLVDSIADYAIITLDTESMISVWNPGAENIFGFTAEEAVGQPISIIYVPEDLAAGVPEQEIIATCTTGRSENERYHIRKDNSRVYISGVMSPLFDSQHVLTGYVKVARDLTQRKQLEQSLLDADRHKDEYIAMLGHELRNPLAPINNVLQILKMTRRDDPTIYPSVELMSRQVDHMVRLVNDLLDLSRISRGKINLRLEEMDLVVAVARAVEMTQPFFEEQDRKLIVTLPENPILINGDLTRIVQIITNLLNNAARFTLSDGVIWLSVSQSQDEAMISIRDNGIGIAKEYQDEIFKPFIQIEAGIDRARGGLGLGLSMVKELVEMHKGSVKVISQNVGFGSEFVVILPVLTSKAANGYATIN